MIKTITALATTLVSAVIATNSYTQVVVYGQADPNLDVPAVQSAIDVGGAVILRGTFSFLDVSIPGVPGEPRRVITVSNAVQIQGDGATILGGGTAAQAGRQGVFLINHQLFTTTFATIEVGAIASGTTILGGSGTLVDAGVATIARGHYAPPP